MPYAWYRHESTKLKPYGLNPKNINRLSCFRSSCVSKRVTQERVTRGFDGTLDKPKSEALEGTEIPGIIWDEFDVLNSLEDPTVSPQATREYLQFKWTQYRTSTKSERALILDEIVCNIGLHRGSAKRIMNRSSMPTFQRGKGVSANSYSVLSKKLLKDLWKDTGYLGAVRLKAALKIWLKHWKHEDLDDYVINELKCMSASTIERVLKTEKSNLRRRINTGTQPAKGKIKTIVPIRELGFKATVPGHCEIDSVAHCGGSLSGSHIWTLTLTDILTGHTECEALEAKNGFEVMSALNRIEDRLPFKI